MKTSLFLIFVVGTSTVRSCGPGGPSFALNKDSDQNLNQQPQSPDIGAGRASAGPNVPPRRTPTFGGNGAGPSWLLQRSQDSQKPGSYFPPGLTRGLPNLSLKDVKNEGSGRDGLNGRNSPIPQQGVGLPREPSNPAGKSPPTKPGTCLINPASGGNHDHGAVSPPQTLPRNGGQENESTSQSPEAITYQDADRRDPPFNIGDLPPWIEKHVFRSSGASITPSTDGLGQRSSNVDSNANANANSNSNADSNADGNSDGNAWSRNDAWSRTNAWANADAWGRSRGLPANYNDNETKAPSPC